MNFYYSSPKKLVGIVYSIIRSLSSSPSSRLMRSAVLLVTCISGATASLTWGFVERCLFLRPAKIKEGSKIAYSFPLSMGNVTIGCLDLQCRIRW